MTILTTTPVIVPADFCGTHSSGGAVPAGVSVGNIRTHDGGFQWRQIETSAGVYSWAALDAAITAYRTAGATVSFCMYGTPTFYASVPDQGFNDKYGYAGGAAYPALDTNLAGLTAFITALVTRYNSAGGTWSLANPTLGKGLAYVETWNEPDFPQNRTEFWWGSAPQMVDVCHTIYAATKAVDSTVTVLAPGFNATSRMEQWLQARGAINTGVAAAATCDALNTHTYFGCAYGVPYANMYADVLWGPSAWFSTAALSARYAPSKPVYITEFGFAFASSPAFTSFLAENAAVRYRGLGRNMLMAAAAGIKRFGCYSIGGYSGDLVNDTLGAKKAFNDVAAAVAGKTITYADALIGGVVTVQLSDGTSIAV